MHDRSEVYPADSLVDVQLPLLRPRTIIFTPARCREIFSRPMTQPS